MDSRLIVYIVWALAMIVVWGLVVVRDWRAYMDKNDPRDGLGDLVSDVALFVSAGGAALALAVLVAGPRIPDLRGFAMGLFLGGYLGAGVIKLTFGHRAARAARRRRAR